MRNACHTQNIFCSSFGGLFDRFVAILAGFAVFVLPEALPKRDDNLPDLPESLFFELPEMVVLAQGHAHP